MTRSSLFRGYRFLPHERLSTIESTYYYYEVYPYNISNDNLQIDLFVKCGSCDKIILIFLNTLWRYFLSLIRIHHRRLGLPLDYQKVCMLYCQEITDENVQFVTFSSYFHYNNKLNQLDQSFTLRNTPNNLLPCLDLIEMVI